MTRVSATEFKNNIGAFSDAAMDEPIIITSHHRDRLVLMSAEEYRRLTDARGNTAAEIDTQNTRLLAKHRNTIMELAKR